MVYFNLEKEVFCDDETDNGIVQGSWKYSSEINGEGEGGGGGGHDNSS